MIRTLKPDKTYNDYYEKIINFVTPHSSLQPKEIHMVCDTYVIEGIKESIRRRKGTSGPKVSIQGFGQHMIKGIQWQDFLSNNVSREELIDSFLHQKRSLNI